MFSVLCVYKAFAPEKRPREEASADKDWNSWGKSCTPREEASAGKSWSSGSKWSKWGKDWKDSPKKGKH